MTITRIYRMLGILFAIALAASACGSSTDDPVVGAGDPDDASASLPVDDSQAPGDDATSSQPSDGAPPVAGACEPGVEQCDDTIDPDDPAFSPINDGSEPGTAPEYETIEPRGNAVNTRAQSWERWEPANGEGTVLRIFFTGGVEPCFVVDRVDVVETADQVTLTLIVGEGPDAAGTACIEIAKFYAVEVELDAAFGDRQVVDGAKE